MSKIQNTKLIVKNVYYKYFEPGVSKLKSYMNNLKKALSEPKYINTNRLYN